MEIVGCCSGQPYDSYVAALVDRTYVQVRVRSTWLV